MDVLSTSLRNIFFQTTFYKQQRKKRGILIEGKDQPIGGKWSFDADNRKKYPKGKTPPAITYPKKDKYWQEAVVYVEKHFSDNLGVPINSLEGFVRQIIGWREFIRGMYEVKGTESRIRNFWGFERKIPKSFYEGTTGIVPVDETIKMVLKTGYCHHIERLMVLGNFMLLCEFHPVPRLF